MNRNLHYGRLTHNVAAKLNSSMPDTLVAGKYRTTEISELSLSHMRGYATESPVLKTDRCFSCCRVEIHCPEDHRVECLCGRTFYKYYDVTDYATFVEQSRWNLFWNRLNFKTLFTSRKQK